MAASPPRDTPKPLVRGEAVVDKVLTATMEEVALTGYEGLTLERVAARSGVNRTTVYRRWPTKHDLVRATVEFAARRAPAFDWDCGSLRADLAELLERARHTIFAPGMLGMHRLMVETAQDPLLHDAVICARADKHAALDAMLERAQRRGELRADLDRELFVDGIFGALFSRCVFQPGELDPPFMKRLVDHLVAIATPPKEPGSRAGSKATSRRKAPNEKAQGRARTPRRAGAAKKA